MTPLRATTPGSPTSRTGARADCSPGLVVARTWVALAAVALAVALVLADPAGAQSPTTVAPTTTVPAENPGSTAAGIVFFGVSGVIVVGALILYLRNRRPTDG